MSKASKAFRAGKAGAYKDTSTALPQAVSCSAVQVVVGPSIVTNVQALNGADLKLAPVPEFCDLKAASLLTGLTRGHIRWILHRFADHFDPPYEQPHILTTGKQGPRWPKRILTGRDIQTLRAMYPIRRRVKQIPPR